jgi:hypothetical protein
MPPKADPNESGKYDEISQPLNRFGCESMELNRLEETAKLMERLEWSIARSSKRPRPDASGGD